jgi:hypothetical protein
MARVLRAFLINQNIVGIYRGLTVRKDKPTDQTMFRYSAMIDIVYWHIATAIDGGTIRRCQERSCGAFFIQHHGGQHFCPPYGKQTESPCANRNRFRRFQRNQRKGKTSR